jgi:hypothetical protein
MVASPDVVVHVPTALDRWCPVGSVGPSLDPRGDPVQQVSVGAHPVNCDPFSHPLGRRDRCPEPGGEHSSIDRWVLLDVVDGTEPELE